MIQWFSLSIRQVITRCIFFNRFFSRKREQSGDRKAKGKTPEPHSPERSKPLGLPQTNGVSSQMLTRNPTVRISTVKMDDFTRISKVVYINTFYF